MFPFDGGGFGIWFLVIALINFACVAGLIVLIVLGIRWLLRNTGSGMYAPGPREDSALATLRERYARGEIDANEYEERRRTLGG